MLYERKGSKLIDFKCCIFVVVWLHNCAMLELSV